MRPPCLPICYVITDTLAAGYEYEPGAEGRITWAINGTRTWQLNANAMPPRDDVQIGQRLVSVEPMYM